MNLEKIIEDAIKEMLSTGKRKSDDYVGNYVIARTYSAGVFAGELVSRDGKEVKLKNARRLWQWAGAASLSQLAMEGVSKPTECKFPCEVDEVLLTECVELLPTTEKSRLSIAEVKIWQA